MPMPIPVILLKTESTPNDSYHDYFRIHRFTNPDGAEIQLEPIFVPVLTHRHVNQGRLERLLAEERISSHIKERTEYSGLIITSQRAVEAMGAVIQRLRGSGSKCVQSFLAKTKVYCVGPATSTAVVGLGFNTNMVLGKHCGTGIMLAEFILDDYNSAVMTDGQRLPLLFLNSEKRGDFVPDVLSRAPEDRRVQLEELIVYETAVMEGFQNAFREIMEVTTVSAAERWIVGFSPTGADAALGVLRDCKPEVSAGRIYWAAIGPTTERHLVKELGKKPDVVAKQPSPQGLCMGISEFRRNKDESNDSNDQRRYGM